MLPSSGSGQLWEQGKVMEGDPIPGSSVTARSPVLEQGVLAGDREGQVPRGQAMWG